MKAAIHNPYLDTLGGGERYTLSFAKVLLDLGYQVDVEWNSLQILDQLEKRFGISLKGINIVSDIKRGDGYDLCFWISDGSVPALKSRKNILHFQVPFHDVNGKSLMNKMKLFRINKVVCNSHFTKKNIDREFGIDSVVVYPPVSVGEIKPRRKENIILNVSRFSSLLQSKHQDVLINNFKKIYGLGYKDWKLILVGGSEIGNSGYIDELIKISNGYPIEIIESPGFKFIKELYGKSKVFWSASGFGVDIDKNPENVEHFGITVVEAMAGAAVPLVYNAGGHREIINDGKDGFLWNDERELMKKTIDLIKNKKTLKEISLNSIQSSLKFSCENFRNNIEKLL